MISSQDLEKCINLLAQISNGASHEVTQKAVEIAYILKKEIDVVKGIEQASADERMRHMDMQGLINDNVQLFHENHKLLQENTNLKGLLESRVTSIAAKVQNISSDVLQVNRMISSLR